MRRLASGCLASLIEAGVDVLGWRRWVYGQVVSVVALVFPLIAAAAILLAARAVGSSARRGMQTMTPEARILRLRAVKRGSIYVGAFGVVVALAGVSVIASSRGPAVGLEFLVPGLALLGVGVFGYFRLREVR